LVDPLCGAVDGEALAQLGVLGCDADRAVVVVAGAHAEATGGLDRGVAQGDGIGSEGEGLDEVGLGAQASSDDEADVGGAPPVEVPSRPGEGRDGRNRDVVLHQVRRGPGATASAVEDDVVRTGFDGEVEVLLDVLRRKLEADGNTAGGFPDEIGHAGEVSRGAQVAEARGGMGVTVRLQRRLGDVV